ncbi:MAG TPA: type II toxin-antitoxin system RelE/ParE family toxin, partial [Steroidobacteraceae bacterium]|nr:type II toxin-antitoxin system RelE/ParE family toxin [Steroidobacteraceae bacterium]
MIVEFLPAADREFREATRYYEARAPGLGHEFIAELEHMRSILDSMHRSLVLRRFPFALIYRIDPTAVRIVAVAHKRRKPGYWR